MVDEDGNTINRNNKKIALIKEVTNSIVPQKK